MSYTTPLNENNIWLPCDHLHTLMAVEQLPIWDGIIRHQIKAEIVYIIYCTELTYVSKLSNYTSILY